jgi:hypothetical protein
MVSLASVMFGQGGVRDQRDLARPSNYSGLRPPGEVLFANNGKLSTRTVEN